LVTRVHFDERGAGFYSLGTAKATRLPAALICTSGTAAVNFYPAIVEASQSGIPLIVLTADRPAHLRDTAAPQTIDQIHLYGSYVRWFVDLPCPGSDIPPEFILTTVDQAVARAMREELGPVHINCQFDEPLVPDGPRIKGLQRSGLPERWLKGNRPFTDYVVPQESTELSALGDLSSAVEEADSGIVVVGGIHPSEQSEIAGLARSLDWPIVGDIQSGLRFGSDESLTLTSHHDLYLRAATVSERLRPDTIIHFGTQPTSKALVEYLAGSGAYYARISSDPRRQDPFHSIATHVCAPPDIVAARR
jgi:2-succinyl-5-enolpyruvyl-6-hydroxy-3-cyclohexene-1-carboxylate synthase